MGYFPNGTSGEVYEAKWCDHCVHGKTACMVWSLHLMHNYDDEWKDALNWFIPRCEDRLDNEKCTMFMPTDEARAERGEVGLTSADQAFLEGKKRA